MKVKNKLLIVAAFSLLAFGVVLIQGAPVSAQAPSLSETFGFEQRSVAEGREGTTQKPTPPADPSIPDEVVGPVAVLVSAEVKSQNMEVLAALQNHVAGVEAQHGMEGWLHIKTQTEAFITASETLPNGDPVPTKWTTDAWYWLDPQGNVTKFVNIQDTGSPTTSQVSILQDGVIRNLTFGFSHTVEEEYKFGLDVGFLATANKYIDNLQLERKEIEWNGQIVLVFSRKELFQEPAHFGKSPESGPGIVGGAMTSVYFSTENGLPLKIEDAYIYPSGHIELAQRITYIVIEKIDTPPAEVLEHLAQ